jgi:hypothetical protein
MPHTRLRTLLALIGLAALNFAALRSAITTPRPDTVALVALLPALDLLLLPALHPGSSRTVQARSVRTAGLAAGLAGCLVWYLWAHLHPDSLLRGFSLALEQPIGWGAGLLLQVLPLPDFGLAASLVAFALGVLALSGSSLLLAALGTLLAARTNPRRPVPATP